ncbi:butyrate kinase [Scandinavium goeteborgense]|uniref:butyrate kinase n=1 Tax=Scandinavium goeteborgense TaxID=1851514 RepID=UPI000F690A50|nr:butyrate kinase [Scandinavium goeteborgense]QKN79834.1 butyrate kinase [Scandinavium goeteborgense]
MKILAINPGSTSTKVALFENTTALFNVTLNHPVSTLFGFRSVIEQRQFRQRAILNVLKHHDIALADIDHFVGRGGLVRPLKSGVYRINDAYLDDAAIGLNGEHASNLGGILAHDLAQSVRKDAVAYTVDPVVVDEYDDIARLSGVPEISRVRSFHPLNQKAVARRYAKERECDYDSLNLIVAHLGGGISVGAHRKGKVVDVNAALGGDGPFSPERSGGVPPLALIDMCYSGQYSYDEMYRKIIGEGGVYAYLGTKDMRVVENLVDAGDKEAEQVLSAMALQIAKEIGACAAVLNGEVDGVILTGGIAHSRFIVEKIRERIHFLTPNFIVFAGEDEMQAMAEGVYDALSNKTRAVLDY